MVQSDVCSLSSTSKCVVKLVTFKFVANWTSGWSRRNVRRSFWNERKMKRERWREINGLPIDYREEQYWKSPSDRKENKTWEREWSMMKYFVRWNYWKIRDFWCCQVCFLFAFFHRRFHGNSLRWCFRIIMLQIEIIEKRRSIISTYIYIYLFNFVCLY